MAEGTALDQQAVEKAHELAQAVYLPAVRAIRKAMDDLQMTYEAKNPIQGEASHKVLAYEVCVAAFAALADAGYSVVKTEEDYEYGYAFDSDALMSIGDYGTFSSAERARHDANPRALDDDDTYRVYRRRKTPVIEPFPWEPVPEGGDH